MPIRRSGWWRDADTTVYLFGTFHLLDGRPWLNDEIKTAFDASGELVLEAILPENTGVITAADAPDRYAIDPSGRRCLPADSRAEAEHNPALRGWGPAGASSGSSLGFVFADLAIRSAAQRLWASLRKRTGR